MKTLHSAFGWSWINGECRNWAPAIASGAGLGLALSLAFHRLLGMPCGTGGCTAVLTSSFSHIGPIPISALGAALWLLYILARSARVRQVAIGVLAFGAVCLLVVQWGVIKGFCSLCSLHAAATLLTFTLHGAARRPRVGLVTALIVVAAGASITVGLGRTAEGIPLADGAYDKVWQNSVALTTDSFVSETILLADLSCHSCVDKLSSLSSGAGAHAPTRLAFLAPPSRLEVTALFCASIEASANKRDAITRAVLAIRSIEGLLTDDPAGAYAVLRSQLEPPETAVDQSRRKLVALQGLLGGMAVHAVPAVLIRANSVAPDSGLRSP